MRVPHHYRKSRRHEIESGLLKAGCAHKHAYHKSCWRRRGRGTVCVWNTVGSATPLEAGYAKSWDYHEAVWILRDGHWRMEHTFDELIDPKLKTDNQEVHNAAS